MNFSDTRGRLAAAWESGSQNAISILAAGVSYYAFLAMIPLLAAIVLSYGIIADPLTVATHIRSLSAELPSSAAGLIGDQLDAIAETSDAKQGIGLVVALVFAVIGARSGAAAVVTAICRAYSTNNDRGFAKNALLAIGIVLGAVGGVILVVGALAITGYVETLLPSVGGIGALFGRLATYVVLFAAGTFGAAALYRAALPRNRRQDWKSVRPGALFAGGGWMLATFGFSLYVANFGSYNATYGSLGAVVVLLTWLYIVAFVLLFGAEINAVGGRRAA